MKGTICAVGGGKGDFIDLANPGHARKQRIIRAIGFGLEKSTIR